ncbi:MAG: DUF58 domain-containing protein [Planctomycetota bacterium]
MKQSRDLPPPRHEGTVEAFELLGARQFVLAVKKLADDLSYGTDRSRFLGAGVEYVQSRPYQYGDPVRSIDWRVTARTSRVHVKEHEAPKRLPCWLLVDTSASMTLSSVRTSKYEVALHIAGALALACLDRVSPVGVLGVGERDLRVQPSLSKDQILQWLLRLRRFRYDEGTRLGERIRRLRPSLQSKALVIVLSDLQDAEALASLELLGQIHDCIAIQLQDPAELLLRGTGFVRAREAETGRAFVTAGRRPWVDPTAVTQSLRRAGVDHLLLRTDQPFVHRLRWFVRARGLLGGGR